MSGAPPTRSAFCTVMPMHKSHTTRRSSGWTPPSKSWSVQVGPRKATHIQGLSPAMTLLMRFASPLPVRYFTPMVLLIFPFGSCLLDIGVQCAHPTELFRLLIAKMNVHSRQSQQKPALSRIREIRPRTSRRQAMSGRLGEAALQRKQALDRRQRAEGMRRQAGARSWIRNFRIFLGAAAKARHCR